MARRNLDFKDKPFGFSKVVDFLSTCLPSMQSSSTGHSLSSHPLSASPNTAWNEFKKTQIVKPVEIPCTIDPKLSSPALRFVCMADTHSLTSRLPWEIPFGDVFLHAGDFTMDGAIEEIKEFNNFLGSLPHKYKVVIAGNHELSFDPLTARQIKGKSMIKDVKKLLSHCIYLEDSGVNIEGISIYGTPWQPAHNDWAFNLPRGKHCMEKWNKIPSGVDVLLTHTPPLGHGDTLHYCRRHVGCVDLLLTVQQRVKPKYHVFGHIHEGYGVTTDDQTTFVNCSTCNIRYVPVNAPFVFDIPLESNNKQ